MGPVMEPRLHYLDTNVLIHIIEPITPLTPAQSRFLARMDDGHAFAITSELALSECLVKPIANGDEVVVEAYMALFESQRGLVVMSVTREILIEAAQLRAKSRMSLPDAIHVSTANVAGCAMFVTEDRRIRAMSMSQTSWTKFEMML